MDIYTEAGKKVIYTGKGGTSHDKDVANKHLAIDKEYTVERIDINNFSSEVFLKEITAKHPAGWRISFNTVMFRDVEDEESEAEYIERIKPTIQELIEYKQPSPAPTSQGDEAVAVWNEVFAEYDEYRQSDIKYTTNEAFYNYLQQHFTITKKR